jgi:hypothetical protein
MEISETIMKQFVKIFKTCELGKAVFRPFNSFFLGELKLCYGDVLRNSKAGWLSERKVVDRFVGLHRKINRFVLRVT